eukprot:1965323-Rhodomonas_salina.1
MGAGFGTRGRRRETARVGARAASPRPRGKLASPIYQRGSKLEKRACFLARFDALTNLSHIWNGNLLCQRHYMPRCSCAYSAEARDIRIRAWCGIMRIRAWYGTEIA